MRIRFTALARADLEAIFAYLSAENPAAAATLVMRLEDVIKVLSTHPDLGRPTTPPGRRVLTVPRLPYRVFYRLSGDDVHILTIRHTSRRPA